MQITQYYQSIKKCRIKNFALVHSVLICLFVYWVIGLFPPKASAEGLSLAVDPPILQIEAIPPADVRAPLTIENQSDEAVQLQIGYKLFRPSDKGDGQIEFLADTAPFPGADKAIFEKIQLLDDNFAIDSLELGPKQKKKLSLRVLLPKNEPFSDYYFSLIFLQTPQEEDETTNNDEAKEKNSSSQASGGIAANVLLSVGPKNDAKGYIEEFSTPWYRETGPVPFALKVKNSGKHYIAPKGVILIKNMFGQTIGKVDIGPENVLTGTSRYLTDTKNIQRPALPAGRLATNDWRPTIVWPETFLLGVYTATLSLAMSDQGPIYTRSIQFVSLPLKLLLGVLIAIVIVIIAYFRIKNRMKDE